MLNIGLLTDQYLAELLNQPGWGLRTNFPHWALIVVPTWIDCRYVAQHYRSALIGQDIPVYFEYGGKSCHVCKITKEGDLMPISISGTVELNRPLLDCLGEMLAQPERSLGLVQLRTERQVSVSGGAGGDFLGTYSRADAQKLYRADYWEPSDLAEFNRDWQQEASVGGEWFEYSYRSFTLGSAAQAERRFDQRFTTRYKLVEGPDGELFQYCENLGVEAIA